MNTFFKKVGFLGLAASLFAFAVNAQDSKATAVVNNGDGTYSVIEYPMDKEVMVTLSPYKGINGTGMAHVVRTAKGTRVVFDVNNAPADWKDVYAYAVDPSGATTLLGPITFSSGTGKAEFMYPGDKFMLVVSPTEGLTTYDPTTTYYYRSVVPSGYTVVPRGKMIQKTTVVTPGTAMTDTAVVATTTTTTQDFTYNVPMYGATRIKGNNSNLRLKFDSGELAGLEAKAQLKYLDGKTRITMKFSDLQKTPMGKKFVLWASSPEGYTKIGQVVHAGKKDTAEINGETALNDFGLFLTMEDTDVDRPTSRVYSTFTYVP